MSREQLLFEAIIKRLDIMERKLDQLNDKVDEVVTAQTQGGRY